jgi:putative transcriptional regulator
MHISYKPLWHTLVERNMRKEDLRIAAGLTTNMIANMGKGKNISMETLVRICEALNCGILDVIELEQDKDASHSYFQVPLWEIALPPTTE